MSSTQSWSYREYDIKYGTAEYKAWEKWMKAHGVPLAQVPFRGWAARDVRRDTVSVLLFDWDPDVELSTEDHARTWAYIDKDDDGNRSASKDARFRVYTVQLDSKPLPFPEEGSGGSDHVAEAAKALLVKYGWTPPVGGGSEIHVYLDANELSTRIRDEVAKNNAALVESLSKQPG